MNGIWLLKMIIPIPSNSAGFQRTKCHLRFQTQKIIQTNKRDQNSKFKFIRFQSFKQNVTLGSFWCADLMGQDMTGQDKNNYLSYVWYD